MQDRGVQAAALSSGTGKDGRVTKGDVLEFLARPAPAQAAHPCRQERRARPMRARNG